MSTSPTGTDSPGRKMGAPAQDQVCQASTKCSEANTSTGLASRMAVPGPLVPADSSAQQAPGAKLMSEAPSITPGWPCRESIQPAASK